MKCPLCDGDTKVISSRQHVKGIRRTRECVECLTRYPTYETILFTGMDKYLLKKILDRQEQLQ